MRRAYGKLLRATPQVMPYPPVSGSSVVFMDMTVEGDHAGRVTIELFTDIVPSSCENFRSLCTGERPFSACPLHYKGVPFHRIVSNFIVQGGDILHKDGRGNQSIFGYPFPNESTDGKAGKHLPATVALAHNGPGRNGSQFFFNLRRSEHLDGKFVVVGQVVDGWDVIQQIGRTCGSRCGTPVSRAWISDCGQSGGAQMEYLEKLQGERADYLQPGREVLNALRPR